MTGLDAATTVTAMAALTAEGHGNFTADLSPDWEIWGPQGGYLAAVALRAAGAAMERARPASINVHFVGAGTSGPVTISVETNRATRVGTSVSLRVAQQSDRGERVILSGSVWGVDDELDGLQHQITSLPVEPLSPDGLISVREIFEGTDVPAPHPFWSNFEQRPLNWIHDWTKRSAGEPHQQNWYRFIDGETFDDRWLDACRQLVVLDVDSWGSATRAHSGDLEHFAPTIELTARFIGDARTQPWLFSDAHAPAAANGLVAHTGTIWTSDGRLVASGGSTLLCRPAARRPDGR